jgi:hypothetical protein
MRFSESPYLATIQYVGSSSVEIMEDPRRIEELRKSFFINHSVYQMRMVFKTLVWILEEFEEDLLTQTTHSENFKPQALCNDFRKPKHFNSFLISDMQHY